MNKIISCALTLILFMAGNSCAHQLDFDILKQQINDIITIKKALVGIAVIYDDKQIMTINDNIQFPLLSVFKLHQALAAADKMHKLNIPFSKALYIKKEDMSENNYSPMRDKYPDGNFEMSIKNIMKYSLQFSDNNACDILFDRVINISDTDKFIRDLGIINFSITENEQSMHNNLNNCYNNWTTPSAAAKVIEFLLDKADNSEYYNIIRKMMIECQTGNNRLALDFLPQTL